MGTKDRKITIDVLVEGPGGVLIFRPIKANKDSLKDLVKTSKNPVIKHNIFKTGTEKKMTV